jgi:transposase
MIERFFSKIKHFRRIATRYDKLARNYAGFLNLVAALQWCR